MSHIDCIRNILNLKDPNIKFEDDFYSEEAVNTIESKVFNGVLTYVPIACYHCGTIFDDKITKHGFKLSTIVLPFVSGFHAYLKLQKQRYYCSHCNSTFTLKTSIIAKNCYISNNTKIAIAIALQDKISEKDIAKNHNVSHSTVSRIIDNAFYDYSPHFNYLPQNICFDEFKSVKEASGAMSFIFCNADTKNIIDIVEDRRLTSLIKYFHQFKKKARRSVKRIVIDIYTPYMSLIKKIFPNAKIVIDRFHIVQLFHRSLNKTRVLAMNRHKDYYNKYKKYWKLLLKNSSNLNFTKYCYHSNFRSRLRETDIVDALLSKDSELKASYKVYQDIRYCLEIGNFSQFEEIVKNADAGVSTYMKTSLKTIKKYLHFVKNTMSCSYTNGVIEGINNKIKVLKRIAFGYRSFLHFRNRILISKGLLKIKAA